MEFLAFYLVVSSILTVATELITAFQIFSSELMFVIPNFVANPIYSWWIFRPIHWLVWFLEFVVTNRLLAWYPAILLSALLAFDFCLAVVPCKIFYFLSLTLLPKKIINNNFFRLKTHGRFQRLICIIFFCLIETLSWFQRFIWILVTGETIILTTERMVGFANLLFFFCFSHPFFRLDLFSAIYLKFYNW